MTKRMANNYFFVIAWICGSFWLNLLLSSFMPETIYFLHIYKEIFPPSKTYLEPCETFMKELFSKNSWQLYAVNYLQTKVPSQSPKCATDPLSSLNIFRIIAVPRQENTCVGVPWSLRSATLLKKRLQHRCFPVNI